MTALRSRRPITTRERLEIILARFENVQKTGTLTPLSKLSQRFNRDAAVLSRVVTGALRSGLVEVKVGREDASSAPRRPDLEQELYKKYPSLIKSIVVAVSDTIDRNKSSSEQLLRYSDNVHRVLGTALALEISRGAFMRSGDRVGIGPGRGVYETVRALQRQPTIRARDVTLVSLSGVGYMRHHAKNRNLLLDPDFIVAFMGEAFEHPVALDLVASPLVRAPDAERPIRSWIGSTDRGRPFIDTAILGVGVFTPGNRFYEEGGLTSSTAQQPGYDSIRPALRSLRALSERLASTDYVPLGDIGYHIFLVPPPGETRPSLQATCQELQRQIVAINKQLLAAHRDDFKAMRSAALVAGTTPKARAVHYLLTNDLVKVSHLCTDNLAAEELLSLR
jgi:DNA-binding transcriptional regulator LsrR (DeoR family)